MTIKVDAAPPGGAELLKWFEELADLAGRQTDAIAADFGEKLPATFENLGWTLASLYRLATCAWGCAGGDHQIEWLAGRVVNHALGAFRLIRSGFYDESLVLTRGIGEIANLLSLFEDTAEMEAWREATRRERLRDFSPASVRRRLGADRLGIEEERYRKLCEVGTHPIPAFAPGHYSGTGQPIMGHIVQIGGVLVTITELAFAVAMAALPSANLSVLPSDAKKSMLERALELIRSLGAINILNYEEKLAELRAVAGRTVQ